jgi:hypothetical protein
MHCAVGSNAREIFDRAASAHFLPFAFCLLPFAFRLSLGGMMPLET